MNQLPHRADVERWWPSPVRGWLFGTVHPARVLLAAMPAALRAAADAGDPRWPLALLGLAWSSGGPLRGAVLDALSRSIERLPTPEWVRLDSLARRTWTLGWHETSAGADAARSGSPFSLAFRKGLSAWADAATLDDVRRELGDHAAVRVLSTMHASGRIREAAVRSLGDGAHAIPALLLRQNDWAAPVRVAAAGEIRRFVSQEHAAAWLCALPLVGRLATGSRSSQDGLLDELAVLFREGAARAALLRTIRRGDTATARAAADLALRGGTGDDELRAALLESRDTLQRLRAVDPCAPPLSDELAERALRDPLASVRRRALAGVAASGGTATHDRLRRACLDASASVREHAVFLLRREGRFDAGEIARDARRVLASGGGDALGALGFLCEHASGGVPPEAYDCVSHPRSRVRHLAKRCLIRTTPPDARVDPAVADDPSPGVARRLVPHLAARVEGPEPGALWHRVEAAPDGQEASAWLTVLARSSLWTALPFVVRALDDAREEVASRARHQVDRVVRTRLRRYASPGAPALDALAAALASCRDPRAAALRDWVRHATGERDWPRAAQVPR